MRRKYTAEEKAAVLAALLEGQGVSDVAKQYRIPEGTVKSWRKRLGDAKVATVATEKKEEIGDLLVGYLQTNLAALRSQNAVFTDPDWLRKQSASDLAVLHGVMHDKATRLLDAMGGPRETPEEGQ